MRLFATAAIFGTSLCITGVQVQAQQREDPAAEWGPWMPRAKPTPRTTEAPQKAKPESEVKSESKEEAVKAPESALPPPAPVPSVAPALPNEFPTKQVTAEDLSKIKLGMRDSEVLAALGMPASRVAIPDDGGHLRETFQYWANGNPIGILRLDNGRVIKIEINAGAR